jgi:hypothetical protein
LQRRHGLLLCDLALTVDGFLGCRIAAHGKKLNKGRILQVNVTEAW